MVDSVKLENLPECSLESACFRNVLWKNRFPSETTEQLNKQAITYSEEPRFKYKL